MFKTMGCCKRRADHEPVHFIYLYGERIVPFGFKVSFKNLTERLHAGNDLF